MSAGQEGAVPVDRHVIKGTLFRKRGSRVTFTEEPPAPEVTREPVRRPAMVAQMLALAHHLQRAIDRGIITDRASVARSLGFTRARVTQLLDLLLLAPDIQELVLAMEAVDGVEPIGERTLRGVAHAGKWADQRVSSRPFLGTPHGSTLCRMRWSEQPESKPGAEALSRPRRSSRRKDLEG